MPRISAAVGNPLLGGPAGTSSWYAGSALTSLLLVVHALAELLRVRRVPDLVLAVVVDADRQDNQHDAEDQPDHAHDQAGDGEALPVGDAALHLPHRQQADDRPEHGR